MNDTIKAILRILTEGTPELQIAAAQVLGELRPRAVAVTQALSACLAGGESFLNRYVFQALANIRTPAAIRELVARLDESGPTGDLVAHLLGEIGDKVSADLRAAFDDATPEVQMRILGILGKIHGTDAVAVAEKALFEPHLTVRAAEVLMAGETLESLHTKSLRALRDRLVKATTKRDDIDPLSLGEVIKVLGRIDGQAVRATLFKHCGADQPAMVRQAALVALRGVRLTPTQANALLDNLKDDDFVHVVEPTMALLLEVEKWNAAGAQQLRKLLSSRREHLRGFVIRALGAAPSEEVVKPLMQHLLGPSVDMSEAASESLSKNPAAVAPLLRAFQSEKDPARARLLAEPLRALADEFTDAQVRSLTDKGQKQLLEHNPMGEELLSLAVAVAPQSVGKLLVDRAHRMRRAKKLEDCLTVLMFLAHLEQLDHEGRYQLAVARLLLDGRDNHVEHEAAGDATMGYFAGLVREGFSVLDRLKRENAVTPEELLRIGAHFAEGVGPERRFGADMLHFVAEKHGKQRAGEEARIALRAEGL